MVSTTPHQKQCSTLQSGQRNCWTHWTAFPPPT